MAIRKNRPVLYEMARRQKLSAGQKSASAPVQASSTPAQTTVHTSDSPEQGSSAPVVAPREPLVTPSLSPAATESVPVTPTGPRIFSGASKRVAAADGPPPTLFTPVTVVRDPDLIGGFRLDLSLGAPALAVVAAVFLVAVSVAFVAGRSFERRPATPMNESPAPASAATDSVVTPHVPEVRREASRESVETPPVRNTPTEEDRAPTTPTRQETPRVELQKGMSYLIVQHFPNSRKSDAEAAARFLTQNGVPCALAHGGDIQLIATEAFDLGNREAGQRRTEQQRADRLQRRVLDLGKEYFKEGRYDFAGARIREIK